MAHVCDTHEQKQTTHMASNHPCAHVYMRVAPHTLTYPYEVSAMKQSSLQPVVP